MALTKRQKQVLDFIANFVDENGYCPSFEEIARGLELASLATVHKHISVLEAKNYLKRGFNQSRSLELTPKIRAGAAAAEGRRSRRFRCSGGSRRARRWKPWSSARCCTSPISRATETPTPWKCAATR